MSTFFTSLGPLTTPDLGVDVHQPNVLRARARKCIGGNRGRQDSSALLHFSEFAASKFFGAATAVRRPSFSAAASRCPRAASNATSFVVVRGTIRPSPPVRRTSGQAAFSLKISGDRLPMTEQKHFVAIMSDGASGLLLESNTPQNVFGPEWNRFCAGPHD